jgi:hypothetical protein
METSLGKSMRVKIVYPRAIVIFGEVRYCRQSGNIYYIGILIEDVIYAKPEVADHIDDVHLTLYAVGRGLTVPEVIRIQNHLMSCNACGTRFAEAHVLNPKRKAQPDRNVMRSAE